MSDDEVYWMKAAAGDGDAFGVIFDRHRARLYRHSRGLAPSFTDADDVVAVTFLEAWRKRDAVRLPLRAPSQLPSPILELAPGEVGHRRIPAPWISGGVCFARGGDRY